MGVAHDCESLCMLPRRQVLLGAAAAVGAVAIPSVFGTPAAAHFGETADPFPLGVASGDPLPSSVILWTRLLRDAGPLTHPVPVGWQVAHDERFRHVARAGIGVARPDLAHSVHI